MIIECNSSKLIRLSYLMKKDLTKSFSGNIHSNPPGDNYPTQKMIQNHIDEIWIINLRDMSNYKASNNVGFRYKFVKCDLFQTIHGAYYRKTDMLKQ